jgi:3-phenylpropionate/cinnamic acid dioxygenase small subunit
MTHRSPRTLAEIADRLEIQDLLTRYCRAIDTRAWDDLDTIFTPDATIDYTAAGGVRGAFPEVKAWLAEVLPRFAMTQHLVTNHDIQVDGDRATSRVYVYNPMGTRNAAGTLDLFFFGGWYNDRLVRTPDGWRIAERTEETAYIDRPTRT